MPVDVATPLPERLLRGAKLLGIIWRSGVFCRAGGWSGSCGCSPKTKFCVAKGQWCQLRVQAAGRGNPREIIAPSHPSAIPLLMTVGEFEASGLTMTVVLPGFRGIVCSRGSGGSGCETVVTEDRKFRVGPKGELSMRDLHLLAQDSESAANVFRVLEAFPGARVVGSAGKDRTV